MIRLDARIGHRGVDDHRAVETERLLAVDVIVRVIEVRSVLHDGEFVVVDAAPFDRVLRDVRGAVHDVRQDQAVPVHGGALGQTVSDVDPYPVALLETERGAGNLAVECVAVDRHAGQDGPADGRGLEIEHLHAVLHTRHERPRPADLEVISGYHIAGIDGGHVEHRQRRRIAIGDHSGRHDRPADLARRQT